MTFRHARFTTGPGWGHEATKISHVSVQLAAKDGTFFAKIAGTQVLYSGSMDQVAKHVANYDKTFSRPYSVSPSMVTAPHSPKAIKGTSPANPADAQRLETLVEGIRAKHATPLRRSETPEPRREVRDMPRRNEFRREIQERPRENEFEQQQTPVSRRSAERDIGGGSSLSTRDLSSIVSRQTDTRNDAIRQEVQALERRHLDDYLIRHILRQIYLDSPKRYRASRAMVVMGHSSILEAKQREEAIELIVEERLDGRIDYNNYI